MMNEILLRLQELSSVVNHLEKRLRQSQTERKALTDRIAALEAALQAKEQAHEDFIHKYEALKLSKSISSPQERADVQQKIDLYLKEIDLCLKQLGD